MKKNTLNQCSIGFTDDDIVEAMREISGYLDITPSDFKEVYQIASRHAMERLKKSIKAAHVMTTPVMTVFEEEPLLYAAKLMAYNNISGLPVLNHEQRVSGIISEKDFLKKAMLDHDGSFMNLIVQCLEVSGCLATDLQKLHVKDIMSTPPICVQESVSIAEVAMTMESRKINRVPVLDENSNLAGIIARSDIVQILC